MSKLIHPWYNKNEKEYMLKVVIDGVNNEEEIWTHTTKAVFNFAKSKFKDGEDCLFEYKEEDGKYIVDKILKKGTKTTKSTTTKKSEPKYKCEDCGKELKTDKYPKCYECNKKKPVTKSQTKTYSKSTVSDNTFRTPEQLTRDDLAQATSRVVNGALIGCTGQLNPNNVKDVTLMLIEEAYKKFQELAK